MYGPLGEELFRLTALVVVVSIIAHSSTDIVIARWFTPDPNPPPATAP